MTELSPHALAEMIEFYEAAAYADVYRAAPGSLGFTVEDTDDCIAFFAPGFDVLIFNRVLGVGLKKAASKDLIESLAARYRDTGIHNYGIQLSPEAQDASLTQWLSACDLHVRDNWTKVYREHELAVPVPTDLRIQRIGQSDSTTFGRIACEGFSMPPVLGPTMSGTVGLPGWHHYIAWDGSTPAGVAALRVEDEIGWLGVGAVLPSFRRRGGQGALMTQRINDGRDLGCRWFITETGQDQPDKPNPSFHNMMRTGFKVAYERPNFMPPKTTGMSR